MTRRHREGPNIPIACYFCRLRKVKCSGGIQCRNCHNRGRECTYSPPQPRRLAPKNRDALTLFRGNFARRKETVPPPMSPMVEISSSRSNTAEGCSAAITEPLIRSEPLENAALGLSPASGDYFINPTKCLDNGDERGKFSQQQPSGEYHGPASWFSILSESGLRWVSTTSGTDEFTDRAHEFINSWTQRLKLSRRGTRRSSAELDAETAWKYTRAYFEMSYDSIFGVVCRKAFEPRLRDHFEHMEIPEDDDPAFYALRNAVYALGCRSAASQDHGSDFTQASAEASQYFDNAFSVYTDLLYTPAGLTAVQALAVMTSYVESLGNPALEYMLCGTAARLAQAQGLHHRPMKSLHLSDCEIFHRSCIFWAIYCCEKYIAFRCGRPSAIDDDDITCEIPKNAPVESGINLQMFASIVEHAQICSSVIKRLSSANAYRQSTEQLIDTVTDLTGKLELWRASLPVLLQPGTSRNIACMESHQKKHGVHLHYLYYGQKNALGNQISKSTTAVAEASRNLILTARHVDIDITFPTWLAFFFPMLGILHLFVFALKHPSHPSVKSDIALLDVGAGYFGHIDFVTDSGLSFSFPKDVAVFAAKAVKRIKKSPEMGHSQVLTLPLGDNTAYSGTTAAVQAENPGDSSILEQYPGYSDINFDFGCWTDMQLEVFSQLTGEDGMNLI